MRTLSVRAFATIGGQGWGRVDFLKDTDGKLYLLEVNAARHDQPQLGAQGRRPKRQALPIYVLKF